MSRLTLFFATVVFLSLGKSHVTQTSLAVLEGIVTDVRNGEPLPSVQVRLSSDARFATNSVLTGTDGRFRFTAVPGEYILVAQRPGFFGPSINKTPSFNVTRRVSLVSGDTSPAQKLTLTPGGVVTGRIVDSAGRPAADGTVHVVQMRYEDGAPSLALVRSAETDQRGEYRIYWAPPGDYLVVFDPDDSTVAAPTFASVDSSDIQTRTFYPGVTRREEAHHVQVLPGTERSGVDFVVQTTRTYRISGRVVNPYVAPGGVTPQDPTRAYAASLAEMPQFVLVNLDSPTAAETFMSGYANLLPLAERQAGYFVLRGIPEGRYDIFATAHHAASDVNYSGRVSVDLRSQDLEGLQITVNPPVDLAGRVIVQGEAAPSATGVNLRSAESSRVYAPKDVRPAENGEFTFEDLVEGTYLLGVTPPEGMYVADLRQGGRSVYADARIRVGSNAPDSVQIFIASNAGVISGSVVHPEGRSGSDTTVVAVPDAPLRGSALLYKTARPDDSGNFTIAGLAPGRYKLFAWEGIVDGAWMNPEFLSKYDDLVTGIRVTPGKAEGLRVPVIWLE